MLRRAIDAPAIRGTCGIVGAPALGTGASFDVNGVMATGKRIIGIVEGDSMPALFIPTSWSFPSRDGSRSTSW